MEEDLIKEYTYPTIKDGIKILILHLSLQVLIGIVMGVFGGVFDVWEQPLS